MDFRRYKEVLMKCGIRMLEGVERWKTDARKIKEYWAKGIKILAGGTITTTVYNKRLKLKECCET